MFKIIYIVVAQILILTYVYGAFSFKEKSIMSRHNKLLPILIRIITSLLFSTLSIFFFIWGYQILFPFTLILIMPVKLLYRLIFKLKFKFYSNLKSLDVVFVIFYLLYITVIFPEKLDVNIMMSNIQSSQISVFMSYFSLMLPYSIFEFIMSIVLITILPVIILDSNISIYIKELKVFLKINPSVYNRLSSFLDSYFELLKFRATIRKHMYFLWLIITVIISIFMIYEGYTNANDRFLISLDYFRNISVVLLIPILIKLYSDKLRKKKYLKQLEYLTEFENLLFTLVKNTNDFESAQEEFNKLNDEFNSLFGSITLKTEDDYNQLIQKISNNDLDLDEKLELYQNLISDKEKMKKISECAKFVQEKNKEIQEHAKNIESTIDGYQKKFIAITDELERIDSLD